MFKPTKNLLDGIRNCFRLPLFPWDLYFARMAEADFFCGRHELPAMKPYFIRCGPSGAPLGLLGGITAGLRIINDLRFDSNDFQKGMRRMGFRQEFIDYLARCQRLNVRVFAPSEGTPFFPNEPIVTTEAPLAHLRLVEGIMISAMNFPTLSLSKWSRLVRTVFPAPVYDFSLRRDQDPYRAPLYAMLAGCKGTSHADMFRFFDFPIVGTTGHEWGQSFGNLRRAFEAWVENQPDKPVMLVDTLQWDHDFPLWLDVVYEKRELIRQANPPVWGWRNDSGPLAELAVRQWKQFLEHPLAQDLWFRERQRTFLTNELDEYAAMEIISAIRQMVGMPTALDILQTLCWAAGTVPGTCKDDPALNGVMKLGEVEGFATIKLALDQNGRPGSKTSLPGNNRSALIFRTDGEFVGVIIYPARRYSLVEYGGRYVLFDIEANRKVSELTGFPLESTGGWNLGMDRNYTLVPQQRQVYDTAAGGFTKFWDNPNIEDVARNIFERLEQQPDKHKGIRNAASVPVYLTPDLYDLRNRMIKSCVLREDCL